MHLPGLVLMNEMEPIINGLSKIGLTVRGRWGEGTAALGHMFQVSNQLTLGDVGGAHRRGSGRDREGNRRPRAERPRATEARAGAVRGGFGGAGGGLLDLGAPHDGAGGLGTAVGTAAGHRPGLGEADRHARRWTGCCSTCSRRICRRWPGASMGGEERDVERASRLRSELKRPVKQNRGRGRHEQFHAESPTSAATGAAGSRPVQPWIHRDGTSAAGADRPGAGRGRDRPAPDGAGSGDRAPGGRKGRRRRDRT